MYDISWVLKNNYGLEATHIAPQQAGWTALAYRVEVGETSYFLKLYEKSRESAEKWAKRIPHYVPVMVWLSSQGGLYGNIPTPLPTLHGTYFCEDELGKYLLYNFIDGKTIGDNRLTTTQVDQFAQIVAKLHTYGKDIPVKMDQITEDFEVPFVSLWRSILVEQNTLTRDVRELIKDYNGHITKLIDSVQTLSETVKHSGVKLALCHTDLHNGNLMLQGDQLMLIDWEGVMLAPVEADLMFLVDQPYYDQFSQIYRTVHGDFELNPVALRFYQQRRKLEDIGEFLQELMFDMQNQHQRNKTVQLLEEELKEIDL